MASSSTDTASFAAVTVGADRTAVEFGRGQLAVICGPCVIESAQSTIDHAGAILDACRSAGLPLIFKSSYDKANRTSLSSFRGVGIDSGLKILEQVRTSLSVPVVTDVHTPEQASIAAEVVDLLQIPAFLCRQTDLLTAAGASRKPVMIKKGQFVAPQDMRYAVQKVQEAGSSAMLCERGTCFGYRELVVDIRSLQIMREIGVPVIFDATHSVQLMGGEQGRSGGARRFVPLLARAAVAAGVDGIFLESHFDPDRALSDGPNMIPVNELSALLEDLRMLAELSYRTRLL